MNKIFKTLNRKADFRIQNKAEGAEVLVYDEISPWGITADSFKASVEGIDGDVVNIRINSPGGDVFDGLTIANIIRDMDAKVVAHIDGLAASIASIIALAADEVVMHEGSFFMIHEPWAIAAGDSREFGKMSRTLDQLGGELAGIYARRGTESAEHFRSLMEEETWLNAEEAKALGFADVVVEPERAVARYDLSAFKNAPASVEEPDYESDIAQMRRRLAFARI